MIDASFLETLARLKLSAGHKSSMNMSGNRKSIQKGSSAEFSDFREYMPGDDIRRIDWNAYGRLDKLYIKQYMEEKEIAVRILLDTSASMNYGASKKNDLAEKLSAAFAYIAMNNLDSVKIYDLKNPQLPFVSAGGKKSLPTMINWINQLDYSGSINLSDAIMKIPAKNPGITIIISDFLQEDLIDTEINKLPGILGYLRFQKQKTILLQVLAKEETEIDLTGTLNLIDMEGATDPLRLTMENRSIKAYYDALHQFQAYMQTQCSKNKAFFAICNTESSFQQIIFKDLIFAYDI